VNKAYWEIYKLDFISCNSDFFCVQLCEK